MYSFEVAEEQFFKAKRRLGVIQKETSHARDVAAAELAEAWDYRELLSGESGVL